MVRCRPMPPALVVLAGVALLSASQAPPRIAPPDRAHVLDTMKRATAFMLEKMATRVGYVWAYLPDISRPWGEIEARPSMIWLQPPGTPTMGHLFLDAYHATGDEYYYRAAEDAAGALILAQHPSGGWNYVFDTAGDESDTSPYRADASVTGISTSTYIRNMSALIRFLDSPR